MLNQIIQYSIRHKLIVLLFVSVVIGFGFYALLNIPIGAVPDVTNNQVQIITTTRNLATEDVEKFITYAVELEMANLPNVQEIRSVSKFGLSVVTVVFDDNIDTYLPRQLIAEKIKSAEEKIPQGFGSPFMGPITTGLGEIYQYTLEVEDGYKDQYNLADLRTIQDWVVKRQLSGIPGVVEVNTWGGFLKQYEVAINPDLLRSLNISLSEVYTALENNNSIAGGGYIEKLNQAFFIRGEGLVNSLEDIENIVISQRGGIPVFVKDVAKVGFGHATRFGAITGNGEGEKVLGQVMMLKDANSKAVIEAVKARVAEIQPTLPEGVYINPFLERSELIGKTTFTIAENLVLGCLIVIFVVVLLLGNLRSGLVVASVIPLCLLFALSLMYIFGVDANLMSLGAIDFGIIIDGAVIIVEYIAYRITKEQDSILSLGAEEKRQKIDDITYQGATKMMHSAVFGQLIIIIVFIPILSLVGVEGKMFKPMALVFCFALIGAMIFCFTYIPVMASLFIKPQAKNKTNFSAKLINFLEEKYEPTMRFALHQKSIVIGGALTLLISVGVLFSTMGGEFVPTLDEGDFVIQPVLKTGTSLSNTVEITTEIEKILLDFPEVDQVVSRIGAAEVPTDPMSMEESDVIIKLKPKSEWQTTHSKDELADHFKEALQAKIPGVDYEFTQPIEMRFNELITGVRADLAIKIFGEDLDILYKKALEVDKLIQDIPGAADISVEKTAGLPQMTVIYNRNKVAKYGLNIQELNSIITTGFAGVPAGFVFEGEKQFDLVIRFDKEHHREIEDIENASVITADGNKLPLSEFATISYTKGPAKISRDDTKRRIVVGVNVRDRDLESVVQDVQNVLTEKLDLPAGYSIQYGGQFENLRTAKDRLSYAVPIALILIFVLLYFAFDSVKEALIIYSAIPLSAVGGVLLLYFRGMPFSISAGVGFIALFGIAVLNGIVLIEEFKELKAHGVDDINERILIGTKKRLRPVLLTAAAAALGFLPMAISTSAGAEVQRPLATVVVGGLVSATALTLVVLPVLYAIFDRKRKKAKTIATALIVLFGFGFGLATTTANAQSTALTENEAWQMVVSNNAALKADQLQYDKALALHKTAWDVDKTEVFYSYDENNQAANGKALHIFGFKQQFAFPSWYTKRAKWLHQMSASTEQLNELKMVDKHRYFALVTNQIRFLQHKTSQLGVLDSLYQEMARVNNQRYEAGESKLMDKLAATAKAKEIHIEWGKAKAELSAVYEEWNALIQDPEKVYILEEASFDKLLLTTQTVNETAVIQAAGAQVKTQRFAVEVERQNLMPDLFVSAFNGSNNGSNAKSYTGMEAGLSFPLFFGASKAKLKAQKLELQSQQQAYDDLKKTLYAKEAALQKRKAALEQALNYYQNEGQLLEQQIRKQAKVNFNEGEINYLEYVQLLEQAKALRMNYLNELLEYNATIIEMNYLSVNL